MSVVFHEIVLGHTLSMGNAPGYVSVILVFIFMMIIGMYEGLQIALVALARVDLAALREKNPVAANNCHLTFGSNLESFLIGRQMFVTVFVVSQWDSRILSNANHMHNIVSNVILLFLSQIICACILVFCGRNDHYSR